MESLAALTTSSCSPATEYPASFSPALVEHCRQGCVPPEVFADARALLSAEKRRRYVRVNPRYTAYVSGVGVEGVLRLEGLSRASAEQRAFLTPAEQELHAELQSALGSSPRAALAGDGSSASSSSASTLSSKEHIRSVVAESVLLRLGVVGLTGLPLSSVHAVPWLPSTVFSLPWAFALGGTALFRDGLLVAMDAASVAAVVALQPQRGERVLDLCCAPGMKLGLIADAVTVGGERDGAQDGLAVGVDLSVSRLYMARATLRKQQYARGARASHSCGPAAAELPVCVFAGDGRSFDMSAAVAGGSVDMRPSAVVDPSTGLTTHERRALQRASTSTAATAASPKGKDNGSTSGVHVVYAPPRARVSLRAWQEEQQQGTGLLLFDRVLVDAECSHDGSVAHIDFEDDATQDGGLTSPTAPPFRVRAIEKGRGLTNAYRMRHLNLGEGDATPSTAESAASSLLRLQSDLLYRGFQALKPGGTLVYSTCSYAFTQNELVVQRFLERVNHPADGQPKVTAVLVPAFSRTFNTLQLDSIDSGIEGSSCGVGGDGVAPCVRIDNRGAEHELQQQLDTHAADYGVVEEGMRRYMPDAASPVQPLGSRFWPRHFACSFLYVAKIWKRAATDGVVK